jgi:hypothetical protein
MEVGKEVAQKTRLGRRRRRNPVSIEVQNDEKEGVSRVPPSGIRISLRSPSTTTVGQDATGMLVLVA